MIVENDAAFLLADKLTKLTNEMYAKIDNLDKAVAGAKGIAEGQELAFYTKDNILSAMNDLRAVADEIEVDMSEDFIPYPTYSDLLYSV
jgi:glutamine synthetase